MIFYKPKKSLIFLVLILSFCNFSCVGPPVKRVVDSELIEKVKIQDKPLRYMQINGTKIRYIESGEGKPLILLHGLMGSSLSWFQNIPYFAEDYHVFAFDFPGLGKSELGNYHCKIKSYSKVLEKVIEEKNFEKPILVGISLGGHVALEYTLNHPGKVDKLVLISPTGTSKPINAVNEIPWIVLWHHWTLSWYLTPERLKTLWDKQYLHSFDVCEALYLKRRELRDPEKYRTYLRHFQTIVYDIKHYSLHDKINQINIPTLILWGTHSKYHHYEEGIYLSKMIKGSKCILFDAGPPIMVDVPKKFNKAVGKFLSETTYAEKPVQKNGPSAKLQPSKLHKDNKI